MTRPVRFRSVRQKLFAGALLTSAVALLVTGSALFYYDLSSYRAQVADSLVAHAGLVGRATTAALRFDDRKSAATNLALLGRLPEIRKAAVYNARGGVFASYRRGDVGDAGLPPLPGAEGTTIEGDRVRTFRRVIENDEIVGTVYLEADYASGERVASYAVIALSAMVVALGLSLAFASWLQRRITRPITEVAAIARHVVDRKDYSVRARRTTEDEIGTLVEAFNDMLSQIESRTTQLEASKSALEREVRERELLQQALRQNEERIRALNEDLEQRVRDRTAELEQSNRQLEAFSYTVSHDLRAPLRAIDGFSQALREDYGAQVNEGMRRYLDRIHAATMRMGQLIEDLLALSRISRAQVAWTDVDLTAMARQILADLAQAEPGRHVEAVVWDGIVARGDAKLLRIALENLLGNAWKFTARAERAHVEFGALRDREQTTYFVRDNGAGFDMAHSQKLYEPFQRLHAVKEFPGSGIGLATVQRVVQRMGGRIWAHAQPGQGATFHFTLGREPVAANAEYRESA